VIVRERLWSPEEQDSVHVDHTVQPPKTQSVAHACVLQLRVSALCGHALPPEVGSVLTRERLWLPPPHDTVHVAQDDHDS
jgi:hypothetical protein